jgi:hypothetical protein
MIDETAHGDQMGRVEGPNAQSRPLLNPRPVERCIVRDFSASKPPLTRPLPRGGAVS